MFRLFTVFAVLIVGIAGCKETAARQEEAAREVKDYDQQPGLVPPPRPVTVISSH